MGSNTLLFESFKILFRVFDVWELKIFVVNYFSKLFDIFRYFYKYQYFIFTVMCNACQSD